MKPLKNLAEYSIFILIAIPLILWLALKASATLDPVVSSSVYSLAIGYALYSLFLGFYVKHIPGRAILFLGIYIIAGSAIVPFLMFLIFIVSGVSYTAFPAIYSLPFQVKPSRIPSSITILILYYVALEAIFFAIWCPFRKYASPICSKINCRMLKLCKTCKVLKTHPCKECDLVLAGAVCIPVFIVFIFMEISLLN